MNEFYNSLLCALKVNFFQSSSHIQKYVFHDQFLIEVFKKVENKVPLTWTWKKMSTLTSFQCFVFLSIFYI